MEFDMTQLALYKSLDWKLVSLDLQDSYLAC